MDKTLKSNFISVLSDYSSGSVFNALDFIAKFKENNEEVYNDFLERYGQQQLHARIGWVLSKYDDELGIQRIGTEENVSKWRKL